MIDRRLAPLLLALTVGSAGCEAVLGTGDLRESEDTPDGSHLGDDDDDGGDDDDASFDASGDAARDGSPGADGSPDDAGDGSSDATSADADAGDGSSSDGGPASVNPSCSPTTNLSAHTCGASGTDDCCATAKVAGGTYYRIDDAGVKSGEVNVTGYDLDVYEVTVGRMRAYAEYLASPSYNFPTAGSGIHAYLNDNLGLEVFDETGFGTLESGWSSEDNFYLTQGASANSDYAEQSCITTYTIAAASTDNRPMNCVSWYDAYAFCIWDGGFLPSEAEWELAAVGGAQQLPQPWGSAALDRAHATYGCTFTGASANECPTAVGAASAGVGPYQQYDLIGNVSEWTLDDFSTSSYSITNNCSDCAYVSSASNSKVDRGGAYSDMTTGGYLSPQDRSSVTGGEAFDLVGFRCARAPR